MPETTWASCGPHAWTLPTNSGARCALVWHVTLHSGRHRHCFLQQDFLIENG